MLFRWVYASCLVGGLLLAAAGCGGEGSASFTKGGPPAPKKCLERWNEDQTALGNGQHAYSAGHDSRAGRVFAIDDPGKGLQDACVAVFAASESDREYGILGWFSTTERSEDGLFGGGWQVLSYYPAESQRERIELQKTGSERANVALAEDGKLTPLD